MIVPVFESDEHAQDAITGIADVVSGAIGTLPMLHRERKTNFVRFCRLRIALPFSTVG
jgi:hypothetical protein